MINVIKLLIFFIVFVIICEAIGLTLLKTINIKHNIVALPIGMALFGCLYEILVLPVQYFHLDSSLLKYAVIVSFIIAIIYGRKEFKNIIKHISKRDVYLLIIFVVLFIIYSLNLNIYGVDSQCSDNVFYIPFVNGISIDGISVNGPMSNLYVNMSISRTYAFYGQLHFYGAVSNLLKVDALITLNFFQSWYIILFYLTNIFNIYKICTANNVFKNINKYLLFIFLVTSYLLILINPEPLYVRTTTMLFIVTPLIMYLMDSNKGWLSIFLIYSIHAVACRSTFIFLLAFFLLPYYLFLLFTNKFKIKENIVIIIPVLFFLILYFSYGKGLNTLLLYLLILFVVVTVISKLVNKIGVNRTKYLYCIILIGIFIFFIIKSLLLGNISATWDNVPIFDVLKGYFIDFSSYSAIINSIYNLSFLFFGAVILAYNIFNKKLVSYYSLHIILIFVLCLNSFVAPYIAHFLSSVYERLFWTWVNPLLYLLILDEFISIFKNIKIRKYVNYVVSFALVLNFSACYFNSYVNNVIKVFSTYKNKNQDVSYFYKVGATSYELGKVIDNYAYDNNLKIVKIALPTNILNMSYVSNKIRLSSIMGNYQTVQDFMSFDFFKEQWNEKNYEHPIYFYLLEPYRFFDDWHIENEYNEIPDIGRILKESNTDIFVINKWKDREETDYRFKDYLEAFSNLLYETDDFLICVIK